MFLHTFQTGGSRSHGKPDSIVRHSYRLESELMIKKSFGKPLKIGPKPFGSIVNLYFPFNLLFGYNF